MKKCLTLMGIMMLTIALYASPVPAWDKPLQVKTKAKSFDPFLTNYDASQYGSGAYRYLRLYMEISQSASYVYKMTLGVYGDWYDQGVGYKYFDVYLPAGWGYKYEDFQLHPYDVVYPTVTDLAYEGPA